MVTNVTVSPVDNAVVIYFQDGSTETVEPKTTMNLQIVENGFVTISETVSPEKGEHPPSEKDLVIKIVKFWQDFWFKLGEEIKEDAPVATPLE